MEYSFLAEPTKFNLTILLWIWIGLVGVVLVSQWRSRHAAGLPLAYVFGLSIMHAFAAAVYSLSHYTPRSEILIQSQASLAITFAGFRVATFGLAAFVIGVLICPYLFYKTPKRLLYTAEPAVTTQLPGTMLLLSLLSFFFIGPLLRVLPSFGSLGTSGAHVSVVAVFLFCYIAHLRQQQGLFLFCLAATFCFPLLTILSMGFAGYGASAATTVWMMVLRFFRPRWLSLLAFAVILYSCLTLYVNWMGERESIRSAVWGDKSIEQRVNRFMGVIDNFEFFNSQKQLHLELIDLRLNQNDLVGKAVKQIELGRIDYAKGETLWLAMVAWIPRILWPGKPVTGGSGNIAANYTGQKFADGTSVGVGQVMEFFINFGWLSVFIGFLFLGLALRFFDQRAAFYLEHGDLWTFMRWIFPGMALLQPGGLVAEMVGSFAANTLFVLLLHRVIFSRHYLRSQLMEAATMARHHPRAQTRRVEAQR